MGNEIKNINEEVYTNRELWIIINNNMEKMNNIEEKIDKLSVTIAGLSENIFEKADKRYASKTSEKIIYGMVGTVLTAVLLALIYLVIIK